MGLRINSSYRIQYYSIVSLVHMRMLQSSGELQRMREARNDSCQRRMISREPRELSELNEISAYDPHENDGKWTWKMKIEKRRRDHIVSQGAQNQSIWPSTTKNTTTAWMVPVVAYSAAVFKHVSTMKQLANKTVDCKSEVRLAARLLVPTLRWLIELI